MSFYRRKRSVLLTHKTVEKVQKITLTLIEDNTITD